MIAKSNLLLLLCGELNNADVYIHNMKLMITARIHQYTTLLLGNLHHSCATQVVIILFKDVSLPATSTLKRQCLFLRCTDLCTIIQIATNIIISFNFSC